jgi:hypothetical protein
MTIRLPLRRRPVSPEFGAQAYGEAVKPTDPVVVHSITDATQARSDDMDARIKRYLLSMGLRTVCVILVLVVHSPVRWVFAVFAVILPYIAVVMANAAGNRRGSGASPVSSPITKPVSSAVKSPIVSPAGSPVTPGSSPISERSGAEKPVRVETSPEQANSRSHEQTA